MNTRMMSLLAGAVILVAVPAHAQDLADRVQAAAGDAAVHFTFESQPGVCGDGEHIRVRSMTGTAITGGEYNRSGSPRAEADCIEGPVQMEIRRQGGRVTDARARVGGLPRSGGVDLGVVDPRDAVSYLLSLDVLRDAERRAADQMIFAATLANAESWPLLLTVARAQDQATAARKSAVFWLAQAAGDRATQGLRSIAGDDANEIELRKHAVFALSQIRSDETIDALIEIARSNREPEIRKNAMFWLGQTGSPRAIAFFEEILRG